MSRRSSSVMAVPSLQQDLFHLYPTVVQSGLDGALGYVQDVSDVAKRKVVQVEQAQHLALWQRQRLQTLMHQAGIVGLSDVDEPVIGQVVWAWVDLR